MSSLQLPATTKSSAIATTALYRSDHNGGGELLSKKKLTASPSLIIEKLESIIIDMECPICLSIIDDTHVVPDCGHRFCGSCIKKSLRTCRNECPTCRVPIATKRTLRQDDLYDNLIQKLSCIIQECSDDSDDFNFETLLDSLKALLWHFQCPVCFQELKDTHVSTECLHRFCKGCIVNHHKCYPAVNKNHSRQNNAKTAVASARVPVALIDAKGELQLNKNVQCPCCKVATKFVPDKSFENINKAIHSLIRMLEQDSDDDASEIEAGYDGEDCAVFDDGIMDDPFPDYTPSEVLSSSSTTTSHGNINHYGQNNGTSQSFHYPLLQSAVPNQVLSRTVTQSTTSSSSNEQMQGTFMNVENGENDDVQRTNPRKQSSSNTPPLNQSHMSNNVSKSTPQESLPDIITSQITASDDNRDSNAKEDCILHNDGSTQQNQAVSAMIEIPSSSAPVQPSTRPSKVTFNVGVKSTVRPKYAIGRRFVNMETETCGRIVGFDGEFYKIVFPQDKEKSYDLWKEEKFQSVKFIQHHKRPSQPHTIQRRQQNKNRDKVLRCPSCNVRFSSNPKDDVSGRAPVQSQNCAHVLCVNCIHSLRINSLNKDGSANSNTNRKLRLTVDCPMCKKLKSFNAVNPNICQAMCQMVQMFEDMEHQRKEDRIREIIAKEEHDAKVKKEKRREREKRSLSSLQEEKREKQSNNYNQKERKKVKMSEKRHSSSTSSSNKKNKHIRCKSCKREKIRDKYSSKQMEKFEKQKAEPMCRRCEEKNIVKHKLGSGAEKVCTTVLVAKKHGSKPKFLTTIVPWSKGQAQKEGTPLPPDLTIDGYTRDSWGLISNTDAKEEECWTKGIFWSSGAGFTQFLKFLKEHKKSAYGTFTLPDQTDGFFVIPFDQPSKIRHGPENLFHSKYIFGLGLEGDKQNKDDKVEKQGSLRNLIAAEFRSSQALSIVPKGSVKVARKLKSQPERAASGGVTNWFRERIVLKEGSDEYSEDDESDDPEEVRVQVSSSTDTELCRYAL